MERPIISCYDPLSFTNEDESMQAVMEFGVEDDEYMGFGGEKKKRLRIEQVRALERSFELDNKLDPDRKVKLALEVGLQPRQVAVWFQNRRARWKGKQMEHDYASLKASYDALRNEFDCLQRDKMSLLSKVEKLKAKLAGESFESVKQELALVESGRAVAQVKDELNFVANRDSGSTESDSSAVLNDDRCCDFQFGSSVVFSEPCSGFFFDDKALLSMNCIDDWLQ